MVKLWKIGWNRIEKVGMGKYKIGLRTNMKNSSREIRIANTCFPFLIEILSLAAETPTKKDVWFLLLLCSHCNLKEELKEVKGQKQYQEEDFAQVWAPCQEEALIAILLFVTLRIRWKLPENCSPVVPCKEEDHGVLGMACSSSWWLLSSWWSPSLSSSASPLPLCTAER